MNTVVKWLHSAISERKRGADIFQTDPDGTPETSIFVCEACDTAFIAVEKRTCSSCETSVVQATTTLDDS